MKLFQIITAWAVLFIGSANAQILDTDKGLAENFQIIYNLSLAVLPVIVLIILIYAGYLYISSVGNEAKISEAKAWIAAGLTGLVILLIIPLLLQLLGVNQ